MNPFTKQKQTHRYSEQTCGCMDGGKWWGGMDWKFETGRCKLFHVEWINKKVLLYSTENYIQSPRINYNRKEYLKKNVICVN